MIHQLDPAQFHKAADLLAGLTKWNVYITAVLHQTSPGRIYVDSLTQPRSAFAISLDRAYLAGDPHNEAFNEGVAEVLAATLLAGDRVNPDAPELIFCVDAAEWEAALAEMLSAWRWPPIWGANRHYIFMAKEVTWHAQLPSGYEIAQLDAALLETQGDSLPKNIADSIRIGWQTRDNFLQRGFGFVALHDGEIVCWCLADVTAGSGCEIGIETAVSHRRLGLATAVTTATLKYCQQAGFSHIGWHCATSNAASRATALKCGFALERPYNTYAFHYDEPRHYAELGRTYFFDAQMYEEAADMLEIAIETDESPPNYVYFLAARAMAHLGEPVAIEYLQVAIDEGFEAWDLVETLPEFEPYRQKPGFPRNWTLLLNQVREGAQNDNEAFFNLAYLMAEKLTFPLQADWLGKDVVVTAVNLTESSHSHGLKVDAAEEGTLLPLEELLFSDIEPESRKWIDFYRHWREGLD